MSKDRQSDARYRLRKKMREAGKNETEINQAIVQQGIGPKRTQEQTTDESIISDSALEANPSEEIQVEGQTESESGFGGLLKRATANLKNNLSDDTPKRGRPSKANVNKDEFSVLVVSVVTLIVTFAKVDERVKPDTNEIQIFSGHLANILLRHLPINNKLSADAIDLIGIFAVSASWYGRVNADLKQSQQTTQQPGAPVPYRANGNTPRAVPAYYPSKADSDFLDNAAANYRGEE